jgi:regulatory protein
MSASIRAKLINAAAAHLARRPHSRGELKTKLIRRADAAEVEAVLDHLEELKLLNDADYAYNFALNRLSENGWGPIKIRHALRRRRIAPELVEWAVTSVQEAISTRLALESCIEKYCRKSGVPADLGSTRRLIAHLRRRGFEDDLIREVMRRREPLDASTSWYETGE